MSTTLKDPVVVSRSSEGNGNGSNGNGASKVAKQPAADALSVEDKAAQIKAYYEAKMNAQLQQAMEARQETAEPLDWWDLFAIGPVQFPTGTFGIDPVGPFEPSRVVRVGEPAFMVSVLILNPGLVNGIVPANILSGAALPYEILYATLNTSTGDPAGFLNVTRQYDLNPGQAVYVEVEPFTPDAAACIIETNVCARILNFDNQTPPQWPFAGFATLIFNTDQPSFLDGIIGAQTPGFSYDRPARYLTYDT